MPRLPDVPADPAEVPVTELSGVGPVRAERLARLGLASVRDLLLFVPRRLELSRELPSLGAAGEHLGRRVRAHGRVAGLSLYRRGRRRSVLRVKIEDADGSLDLLFYNQAWMRKRFEPGDEVRCEGLLVDSKGPAIAAPRLVPQDESTVEPVVVYPLTDGIGQELLRKLCRAAARDWAAGLREPLDGGELVALGLPSLPEAARRVHRPRDESEFLASRRRLALEPLLGLQARLAQRRARRARGGATAIALSARDAADLSARFPAPFTSGQTRVARELAADLARTVPMRRLLQGDVGSGKTWIAAWAAAAVARAGRQSALMVPTETLAEQHALGLAPLFESLGVRSVLLTGSLDPARARAVREELAAGRAKVAIGTHALLSEATTFRALALAVVDEQHRFGVAQRGRLFEKGRDVHVLLMTATPIPRTLALTLYGDLETSVLRGRPAGRAAVATRRVAADRVEAMCGFLVERLRAGERAFWVAPRIAGEAGAEGAWARWCRRLQGTGLRAELVHGRLSATERLARMERFRSGEAGLLVGTTVVEVGIDVPEATVMVVEEAHRLGLAQLHQLRGRVGRGPVASWCFLLGDESAGERLDPLVRSSDGFELAELDLLQRGMGSLVGSRQAGVNDEGLAAPESDFELVAFARRVVTADAALRERYAERVSGR